ncbi:MAG: benzoyl-CoA 2,3-epoxidase subunit BoxB [Pyrinomonadaceae bacterium]|nr:benzoyl-CoA 2,3-epoxidase subunit BoxB [Pyrinomonadaceae bacterium]MBA3570972.1 benzoyl-CoA 2,3-epoxidase subunit BoxB [Pyrinomonadaceae bacterium]
MNLYECIPNNVNLAGDKRLQRALEKWLPNYLEWWREMGPEGFQNKDVYLRTAISVEPDGWANFDFVKMPDYRWGIFLKPAEPGATIGFGDNYGQPAYQEVPGEFRNSLRRIIVTQGDTEPASVEQQRELGKTCPSLYDLRNLFQVNVEEGRHLWAMVYLLQRYFGRDGRDEADALLERRSGNPDKPRILEAFNQPCDDWLNFFCFTMFTDRDGKYQLSALAESGFEPLARTCQFMLTEEAHHMFVGDTGINRIVKRTAQLMKAGDVHQLGGIPLDIIQKHVNFWFSYSLDLFGGEISSNSADFFAAGLKGRYKEQEQYDDHIAADQTFTMTVVEDGRLNSREVALRNALNEVLRGEYVKDCEKGLARWNKTLADAGISDRIRLPNTRFHRHVGEYAGHNFDIEGKPITSEEFEQRKAQWLPTLEDREYVRSLMHPVVEPGKIANWISPPAAGVKGKPFEFEYVRL